MTSEDIYGKLLQFSVNNKYLQIYINLCEKARSRGSRKNAQELIGYVEAHHIIPRSFDSTLVKSKANIVNMSAREHFLAHKLLIRIATTEYSLKAKLAILKFLQNSALQQRVMNSRDYEYVRKMCIECSSGVNSPRYGKPGVRTNKICITNGEIEYCIDKGTAVPDGFTLGRKTKGYIVCTNGTNNIWIRPNETPPEGYYIGTHAKGKPGTSKGKICITDGKSDKYIDLSDEIPEGWKIGRIQPTTHGKICITNGVKNRHINPTEEIPDGFAVGSCSKNRIAINNGIVTKYISSADEIPNGWVAGGSPKSRNKLSAPNSTIIL